jgi:hypothetical protein
VFTVAAAATVLPAAVAMRTWGRKPVVLFCVCLGITGACLELLALHSGGFGLLTLGALLQAGFSGRCLWAPLWAQLLCGLRAHPCAARWPRPGRR